MTILEAKNLISRKLLELLNFGFTIYQGFIKKLGNMLSVKSLYILVLYG